jgi:circadian clock protein KaiA
LSAQFLIGVLITTAEVAEILNQRLAQKSFVLRWSQSASDFQDWVTENRHRIDCLIVESSDEAIATLTHFKQQDILLPALTVYASEGTSLAPDQGDSPSDQHSDAPSYDPFAAYHEAVICLDIGDIDQFDEALRQAVDQYLRLPADSKPTPVESVADKRQFLLSLQQQRLSEKLQERLGYMGVYYKRNKQNFLRNMSPVERQEFLEKLRQDYRLIILNYFSNSGSINQKIDDFVNVAFFADISVPKIVEIHMELIDDFSKQLQLEGRSDDILADYRLTLIDVIAHLCEMYRRSVPREM